MTPTQQMQLSPLDILTLSVRVKYLELKKERKAKGYFSNKAKALKEELKALEEEWKNAYMHEMGGKMARAKEAYKIHRGE